MECVSQSLRGNGYVMVQDDSEIREIEGLNPAKIEISKKVIDSRTLRQRASSNVRVIKQCPKRN